ncbi:MAG: VirB8 family type IV secretion system protein [Gammaproteobacteria bacterium]
MNHKKSEKSDDKASYYTATTDWAYEMYQSKSLWLRRALFSLAVLAVLLALSLVSNLYLLPLKEKVPYLYAFDHATGEVTKIGILEPTTLSSNWELSRYFLIRYVINYESFDNDNIDIPYQLVWAQSADNVRKQYEESVKSSNSNSPYRLYGKDKYVTVRVVSVSRLNDKTVDVKFERTLHDRASDTQQITQKEAIIKWDFSDANTTQKMLDRDPLGFKVTYYQVSQVSLNNNL